MKLRILTALSVCFFSLIATGVGNSDLAMDTLRDLQRGVRNGYMHDLSPEKQQKFVQLLSEAADLLYRTSSQASYSCVSQGNGWYAVVNLDTNEKLGENVGGLSQCQEVLPPAGSNYACINQGNGWYAVFDMIKVQKLGENVGGFGQCATVVPANNAKFACINQGNGWYAVFNLKTGVKLGENVGGFGQCQQALPAVR